MRRPRTAALALAGGLLLGGPALSACSEEPAADQVESTTSDQEVENQVEDLDDEGAVDGVGGTDDDGAQDLEDEIEDLDDEGAVDGVEGEPQ